MGLASRIIFRRTSNLLVCPTLRGGLGEVANNDKSITGKFKDVGFLREVWQQIRLVFYLIRDSEVPIYLKLVPFVGILYTLFPIDLVADFVPVLGQLDDLTILLIGAKVFIEMAPPQVVARYMAQMRGDAAGMVIEGTASDGAASDAAPDIKLIEGEIANEVSSVKSAESAKRSGLFRRRGQKPD